MKSSERAAVRTAPVQRQAAAHAGADGGAGSPRQQSQGEQIAQLVKKHHDPREKKHLSKDIGNKQVDESARALAIKKSSPVPLTNKEAKRQARER